MRKHIAVVAFSKQELNEFKRLVRFKSKPREFVYYEALVFSEMLRLTSDAKNGKVHAVVLDHLGYFGINDRDIDKIINTLTVDCGVRIWARHDCVDIKGKKK